MQKMTTGVQENLAVYSLLLPPQTWVIKPPYWAKIQKQMTKKQL
jgi:hypothetical protein